MFWCWHVARCLVSMKHHNGMKHHTLKIQSIFDPILFPNHFTMALSVIGLHNIGKDIAISFLCDIYCSMTKKIGNFHQMI